LIPTGTKLRGIEAMKLGQQVRSSLRLSSGLVMLTFVICHLTDHSLLLVSPTLADAVANWVMYPWHTRAGIGILTAAFSVHYCNALWSIYVRRSLRLSFWQWTQISLGLCIPILLMTHIAGTRLAESLLGAEIGYRTVLIGQWQMSPGLAVLQTAAVVTVWTHACVGIHFWLRTKPWYPGLRAFLFAAALLLPALALAGFVAAGNEILRAAADPDFVAQSLRATGLTADQRSELHIIALSGIASHVALVALVFVARGVRGACAGRGKRALLYYPAGRAIPLLSGATVLETLRAYNIPHAAVCGGRARCTTCRILVTNGLDAVPAPSALEAKALARIRAPAGMRLACQVRPTKDIAIMPLLGADASAAEGRVRGGLEGSERPITIVFVDIRGSTKLGEEKLPYDVLFILNRFFQEMSQAVATTGGHYSQFTGDGMVALYGLHDADPAVGPADAVRGAREMLMRLEQLNRQLRDDLSEPLRIGIGIHYGEAIVGAMGPPRSQIVTAIGDTVNTCARLESLTKDYDCAVAVSRRAAEVAGLDFAHCELHQASVKGRVEPVQFYAVKAIAELPVQISA
jgi:adenylate cyclase